MQHAGMRTLCKVYLTRKCNIIFSTCFDIKSERKYFDIKSERKYFDIKSERKYFDIKSERKIFDIKCEPI